MKRMSTRILRAIMLSALISALLSLLIVIAFSYDRISASGELGIFDFLGSMIQPIIIVLLIALSVSAFFASRIAKSVVRHIF